MTDPKTEPLIYAKEVVGSDPWAKNLGITVEEVREAYARCSVTVKDEYCNAANRAHGALTFAVSDQAFAVACNSTGTRALAITFNITYMGAAKPGSILSAVATPKSVGRKVSVWLVEVHDSEGTCIATGEGIAYHKTD